MEDINLHFTGDFHAIGAANNLLAAMLDNHIQQGNELGIDVRKITWKRVVDMNDRQLRNVVDGMGGKAHGVPREDGFDITVASEIMAIFCLSTSITDLKERLARIVVGYTRDDKPVTAGDLKAQGAMAALLKDALKPNLVQTLEGTPAFVHGGPFANIAHGCNSIMATRMAMALGDYCVTEAGFGADLGAEKFLDIKCRGPQPRRGGRRGHGARAEEPRRRGEGRSQRREPRGVGGGSAESAAARGEHHEGVPAAVRRGHQPLPHGHGSRAQAGGGQVPRAGRERGVVRGVGEGRRGRPGPGRRSGAPVRRAERLPVRLR